MKTINRIKSFWTRVGDSLEDTIYIFFVLLFSLLSAFSVMVLLCIFIISLLGFEIPRDVLFTARISFGFLLFVFVLPFFFKEHSG